MFHVSKVCVVILSPFQFSSLSSANLGGILSWLNWRADSIPESVIVYFGTTEDKNHNIFLHKHQRKLTSKYNWGIGAVIAYLWISRLMKYGKTM